MRTLTSIAVAAALSITGTAAFAEQDIKKQEQAAPIAMNDAQLEKVSAGLITLLVVDAVDVEDNQVQVAVPVNAAVAAGVLGAAGAGAAQLGNITQRR